MTTEPFDCQFCFDDGDCGMAAMRMGWCGGLTRLVAAVHSTGDEEFFCWCGERLAFLPRMNAWTCSTHGLADYVNDADGKRVTQ